MESSSPPKRKTTLQEVFFIFLVLLVSTAFFGLIQQFILAVFWAIVFAILFYRRYELILSKMPAKPNAAAGLTLVYVLLLVIIPVAIVGTLVINEASDVYVRLNANEISFQEQIANLRYRIPIDDELLAKFDLSLAEFQAKLAEFLASGTKIVAGKAVDFTQNIFGFFVNFFLMLYILFFFLRDGKKLVQDLIWVLPFGDVQEWTLVHRFERVIRATVKGSLLVALAQGSMGGLVFWILQIPAPFLWGVIMIITSLLPVGSALVWGPWVIVLLVQGSFWKAVALLIIGSGFIGLIDNLLRPRLVGQDTKLPDYLILLSTLGGLAWFGLTGFVLGPVIAALFVTCWQMLGKEYGESQDKQPQDIANIGGK